MSVRSSEKPEGLPEIVVVAPFWSQSDGMNWDSNYAYLRIVLPELSRLKPHWLFIVLWPESSYGNDPWKWHGDSFFTDRIVRYPWPYDTSVRTGALGFDPIRFRNLDYNVAPGIYWLHQTEMGAFISGGYKQSFNRSARPNIVAQHHYVIHDSLPYPMDGMFNRLWLQLGGAYVADRNVFNSEHCAKMLKQTAAQFVGPTWLKKVEPTKTTLPFGLLTNETEVPIRPHDKPLIVYNHRQESYKQPLKTAAAIEAVRKMGDTVEVWATQQHGQNIKFFPVDKLVGDPVRAKYIQNIAVPAINVSNSTHETYCIAMVDSIALGHLPLAPRGVTFPELVPADYPYLFSSEKEQIAMLHHLLTHWPAVYEEWSGQLRHFAAKRFGLYAYARKYADILAEAGAEWLTVEPREHTVSGLNRFFASMKPGHYELQQVHRAIQKATNLQSQAMTYRRTCREWAKGGGKYAWARNQLVLVWD